LVGARRHRHGDRVPNREAPSIAPPPGAESARSGVIFRAAKKLEDLEESC
jgi:hypothetical protein